MRFAFCLFSHFFIACSSSFSLFSFLCSPRSLVSLGLPRPQRALVKRPVWVCKGPCHALECPLQDPIPRSLWDRTPVVSLRSRSILSLSALPSFSSSFPAPPGLLWSFPVHQVVPVNVLRMHSACPTSLRRASSSSLLDMGSLLAEPFSSCGRRCVTPTSGRGLLSVLHGPEAGVAAPGLCSSSCTTASASPPSRAAASLPQRPLLVPRPPLPLSPPPTSLSVLVFLQAPLPSTAWVPRTGTGPGCTNLCCQKHAFSSSCTALVAACFWDARAGAAKPQPSASQRGVLKPSGQLEGTGRCGV